MEKVLNRVLMEYQTPPYTYRRLNTSDAGPLSVMVHQQKPSDLLFFKPHGLDNISIKKQFKVSSFLMMGVFYKEHIIGYFFLRFFINKKCFVGRLIDKDFRGKGIGMVMNSIMYETAWRLNFRCLSTISLNNAAIMHAHSKNPTMVVVKELPNNYLLVEFVRNSKSL